jgi:hypothetical protein
MASTLRTNRILDIFWKSRLKLQTEKFPAPDYYGLMPRAKLSFVWGALSTEITVYNKSRDFQFNFQRNFSMWALE